MTEKHCAHCGESFQAKRSTAKFCSNAHRQAHFKREHDPLIGTAAREAARAAGLEKKMRGQQRKWTIVALGQGVRKWRGYAPPPVRGLLGADPGGIPADFEQDSTSHYDARLVKGTRKRKKARGESGPPPKRGRRGPMGGGIDGLEATWDAPLNWYESSVKQYLRALEALREPTYPELEVALWHLQMEGHPRKNLVGFFEGNIPLIQAVQTMRKLDDTLRVALGAAPATAADWLAGKRTIVGLYGSYAKAAEREQMLATDIIVNRLDRIEQLESMRAETLDQIRETVEKIAAWYPDDERINEAARELLDD
jgi:hypothetical protein